MHCSPFGVDNDPHLVSIRCSKVTEIKTMANKRHKLMLTDGSDTTAMGVLSSQLSPLVDDGSIAVGDIVQLPEYTASIVQNNVCLVIVDLKHVARPEGNAAKVGTHSGRQPPHAPHSQPSSARLLKTLQRRAPRPTWPRLPSSPTHHFKPPTTSLWLTTRPPPRPCTIKGRQYIANVLDTGPSSQWRPSSTP